MELLEDDNPPKHADDQDFERYGEADDLGFLEAARGVLESHLGTHWLVALGVVLLIVLWPIVVFWTSIAFDASRFVEEWIKLSVEGLLLFLLLEIMRHRSVFFDAHKSVQRLLFAYVSALRKLIAALTELREKISASDSETATSLLRIAASSWKTLTHGLSDEFIHRLPERLRANLLTQRLELRPQRCESILKSLHAARRPEDYNLAELDELIQRSDKLLNALMGIEKPEGG